MATKLKTVEYWFPYLATAADNTDTNFTQITIYIPESSIAFKSVVFDVSYHDANTTLTGTNNRRQVSIQLGAAGYSTVNNTNVYTLSGEQYCAEASGDFTSYFTTNWTGTSMTCDGRFLYDMSTASPLGARSICGRLTITYSYDDTSATQVKTVRIPLNAPVGAMGTTKPGTPTDTIPALDTFLPEASKTIRQTTIVVQGNTNNAATTDNSMTWQIDTNTAFTSQLFEGGGNSDMWYRLCNVESFTTNTTHGFYVWGSAAKWNHAQAYMVVTYEYNESTTTSVMNSIILPMELASPMGGTTSADYQRGTRELFIAEPGTITTGNLAFYMFWDQAANIGGLNTRIGTGSFVAYTDVAATLCGGNGLMIRNDSAFTLQRGRNSLNVDVYRTDATDLGFNVSGFFIVNYTSDKATQGSGAHNHSVIWNIFPYGTGAANVERTSTTITPEIPSTNYFITAIGTSYRYISNTTGNPAGVTVLVERPAGEGGQQWESAYTDIGYTDPETGVRSCWSQCRTLFNRYPGDLQLASISGSRMEFEAGRRWKTVLGNNCASFDHLDIYYTYHAITFTVSGNITNSNGGTITIQLVRIDNEEVALQTSRVGDGSYSFEWYDDTSNVYVVAYEDATYKGVSKIDVPGSGFDISLSAAAGGGEFYF